MKKLIVEGEADKKFFEALCKRIDLGVSVEVNTPKDVGAVKNGKTSASDRLSILIKQLADGNLTHLAMVLDADYCDDTDNHWGYDKTLQHIQKKIAKSGYNLPPNIISTGLSFPHSDGFNPFGLWVMPDNQSEGMLEDWVKAAAKKETPDLLEHAITTIEALPHAKFKDIHKSKAEIATWMAWQKIPGEGVDSLISIDLINWEHPSVTQLIHWLKHIYNA